MPEGIYSAAAGMASQQAQMDAISNDLANVDTVGYHAERLGFRDLLYSAERNVPVGAGSAPIDLGRTSAEGSLQQTGNPLDLAIAGPGYFQVREASGTVALTRNGQFGLDASGSIVTESGQRLVPPITVPKGTQPADIVIAPGGAVTVKGKTVGKIALVDVPAPGGLAPAGDSLFATTAASGAAKPASSATIEQGTLETSNVDLSSAMVQMIEAQRGYELASTAIKTQSELLNVANQIVR